MNICVGLETVLDPFQLLNLLLKIELDHGRERFADGKYTSRPLDIDIIYYDQYIIDEENLIVPHPHMPDRKFVLKPLADIAPAILPSRLKKGYSKLIAGITRQNQTG